MNPRALQKVVIAAIMGISIFVFILVLAAHFSHNNFKVPLAAFFRAVPLAAWDSFGVVMLVAMVGGELLVFYRPAILIRVLEVQPERTGPTLHIRCRSCGVVNWVQDATKKRPVKHFCPSCGTEGTYDEAQGSRDFIYTEVEVKLGCRNCRTTFTIPEPLVRPLFTQCPNCQSHGVLGKDARTVQAVETATACVHCGFGFNTYEPGGRRDHPTTCPRCNKKNPRTAAAGAR